MILFSAQGSGGESCMREFFFLVGSFLWEAFL